MHSLEQQRCVLLNNNKQVLKVRYEYPKKTDTSCETKVLNLTCNHIAK